MARFYDQAIQELNKILEMNPNYLMAHVWLASNYRAKGMFNEALIEIKKWRELSGEDDAMIATVAQIYGHLGKRDVAEKLLDKVLELSEQRYVSPFDIAEIYVSLDQKDQAFEWFEKAYEARDHWLIFLKIDPVFESLNQDPRFKALLKKIGLER
jgi:tetratricopeptide (TPR) repeat protein